MRFLNHVVNPVVRVLLRSPLHGLLSSSLALLAYTGRRTGRRRALPVMYARVEDRVVRACRSSGEEALVAELPPADAGRGAAPGTGVSGSGHLAGEGAETERALALYLGRFPRAAKALGVPLDGDGRPDPATLARAAAPARMVVIELTGESRRLDPA